MTSLFKPDYSIPSKKELPAPTPIQKTEEIQKVEDPLGTEERRLKGAREGYRSLIWLPVVGGTAV